MPDNIKSYEFKKALEALTSFEGRGTELISLYVPPNKPIFDVISYLRDEYSTSSNIKSKGTRKNVTSAIESMMSRLKMYKVPPPTGLAMFIGSIPTKGDQTEMVTFIIEPPEPITSMIYRCDSKFYLDPLTAMLGEKDVYGLIVIDRSEATIGYLRGTKIEVVKNIQSQVPSKHHQGGQSSRRFERLIEIAAHEFFVKVGETASNAFLTQKNLKGIFIGGPGATKEFFAEKEFLHYELQKKIVELFDTGYTDEYGLKELVEKAADAIDNLEIAHEKKIIDRFMGEIKKSTDSHATYGEKEVRAALLASKVDTLILSEGLRKNKVVWQCPNCHKEITETVSVIKEKICPDCNVPMIVKEQHDIVEELYELAESTNAKIEFIGNDSEEGKIFQNAFGGIGALLRY